ncbi:MAG TPA: hypothetical protein VG710_08805 [Opitutus sp.]|nr:hypothetical protein [Opitutus sp.]
MNDSTETPAAMRLNEDGAASARAAGSAIPLPPYRWVPVADVLAIIRDKRWSWVRNNACKYIDLRIDTRNEHCLIFDRDHREITIKDLSRQLDDYLSPNSVISPYSIALLKGFS